MAIAEREEKMSIAQEKQKAEKARVAATHMTREQLREHNAKRLDKKKEATN